MARKTWRCFHCDELFRDAKAAAEHFGADSSAKPACKLATSTVHLVRYIRQLEKENARHRREDSDILRAMASKEAEQAEAVRKAEERGYERGLRDASGSADSDDGDYETKRG